MTAETDLRGDPPTSTRTMVRVGLLLSLVVLLLGSVRFARYDWTGLPIERAPLSTERQVSPECLEQIGTYTTESGRVVERVVVDEQQYMALVQYFRGVPESELQWTCLYDPFSYRSGVSWLAHWLPFDEALSLAVTNVVLLLASVWLVLATLRASGVTPRVLLATGVLFTVGWNTFYFGSGLLVETGVLFAVALGWYLIVTRRAMASRPAARARVPVEGDRRHPRAGHARLGAAREHRERRDGGHLAWAPAAAAAVAFVAGVVVWRGHLLPTPDASWQVTPSLTNTTHNLTDVVSLFSFAVGVGPLFIPAFLQCRRMAREDGWFRVLLHPAVVGVVLTLGISAWSFITVDLTPRLMWMGFPFAASLAADWWAEGRPREWLESAPVPGALR